MKNTDFLKLNLPELKDKADILKVSEDMEWIDEAVKSLNEVYLQINQRLSSLESRTEYQSESITDVRNSLVSLGRKIDDTIVNLRTLESKVGTNEYNISRIATNVMNLSVDSEDAKRRFETDESKIAANTKSISDLSLKLIEEISEISKDITQLNTRKVDKEGSKGLSANDYSDAEKAKLSKAVTDISNLQNNKVEKESGKSLSTNDYSNAEKLKLTKLSSMFELI